MSVVARPAATVILLRDGPDGVEAWLLRRVAAMAFAAGATVFPGGRVDEADHGDVAFAGADPALLTDRFGGSAEQARASVVAAIRETFEETGVLLTRPPHDVVSDAQAARLARRRRQVEAREVSFTAVLTELDVAVDADLIRAWARWITPSAEPRRYDTRFYVAALPPGATADAETTEAAQAQWIRPAEALAEYERGERPMLTPTMLTLGELAGYATVAAVLAASAARSLAPIEPEIVTLDSGERRVRLPDGRLFPPPPPPPAKLPPTEPTHPTPIRPTP
jgi:8-oxo-dGTP pyrophosphatase MutT (NUDIX family)